MSVQVSLGLVKKAIGFSIGGGSEGQRAACAPFYRSFWLAKNALVSPQVGLVHSGQRRVSWREQTMLDFRWDWTKSARAWTEEGQKRGCYYCLITTAIALNYSR